MGREGMAFRKHVPVDRLRWMNNVAFAERAKQPGKSQAQIHVGRGTMKIWFINY
jgi:hypothetical protein